MTFFGEMSEPAACEAKEKDEPAMRKLRVAVTGCVHGEMDKVYDDIAKLEAKHGYTVDLVICCGDFQAVRNYGDLHHMHVNEKYRRLMTFYKYYSGEKTAPILTLFVGGNHEASGYMTELPNGGWVAKNIYFMGFSNVVRFAGLRIAGLSGIYKSQDYHLGHFECPPFKGGDCISAYHVRSLDVFRLRQLRALDEEASSNKVDIVVSHDWPAGITDYGNVQKLLQFKPYFRQDIEHGRLGNAATLQLLQELKPKKWFAAHLHCHFTATVEHAEKNGATADPTQFLALDKPIPGRRYLEVVEIDAPEDAPLSLEYDPAWLAILKNTNNLTKVERQRVHLPSKHSLLNASDTRWDFRPTADEIAIMEKLGDLKIPRNFELTAPPLRDVKTKHSPPSCYYKNPQSAQFCQWLGISNLNDLLAMTSSSVGIPFHLTNIEASAGEVNKQNVEEFGDANFVVDGAGNDVFGGSSDWVAPASASALLANFEAPAVPLKKAKPS